MTTMRTVAAVLMMGSLLVAVGCTTEAKVQVNNETDKTFPVSVRGGGVARNLGAVGPYDNLLEEVEFKNKKLPAAVALKVGKLQTTFTVRENAANVFRYRVTSAGALVPRGEGPLTVEEKVKTRTPLTEPQEVIE